jgi:hypothetical protein
MYRLYRSGDEKGDAGGMSIAIKYEQNGEADMKLDSRPLVGYRMRVGSAYARSMQWQDWWQTTPVTEIVSDEPTKVVFKTQSGSEYTWETDNV